MPEDRYLAAYARLWLTNVTSVGNHTKNRTFKLFGMNSSGLNTFLPRYLTPQKPPKGFSSRRACIHLTSIVPYMDDAQVRTNQYDDTQIYSVFYKPIFSLISRCREILYYPQLAVLSIVLQRVTYLYREFLTYLSSIRFPPYYFKLHFFLSLSLSLCYSLSYTLFSSPLLSLPIFLSLLLPPSPPLLVPRPSSVNWTSGAPQNR